MHKLSRAFNGDSILALPSERLLVRRTYATFDMKNYKPAPGVRQTMKAPQKPKDDKDDEVVIEALQRLLRKKEDKPQRAFTEFGQARPIR